MRVSKSMLWFKIFGNIFFNSFIAYIIRNGKSILNGKSPNDLNRRLTLFFTFLLSCFDLFLSFIFIHLVIKFS